MYYVGYLKKAALTTELDKTKQGKLYGNYCLDFCMWCDVFKCF